MLNYSTENLPQFIKPFHFIKEAIDKQRVFMIVDVCSISATPNAAKVFPEFVVIWDVKDKQRNYIQRPLQEIIQFINNKLLIEYQPEIK